MQGCLYGVTLGLNGWYLIGNAGTGSLISGIAGSCIGTMIGSSFAKRTHSGNSYSAEQFIEKLIKTTLIYGGLTYQIERICLADPNIICEIHQWSENAIYLFARAAFFSMCAYTIFQCGSLGVRKFSRSLHA